MANSSGLLDDFKSAKRSWKPKTPTSSAPRTILRSKSDDIPKAMEHSLSSTKTPPKSCTRPTSVSNLPSKSISRTDGNENESKQKYEDEPMFVSPFKNSLSITKKKASSDYSAYSNNKKETSNGTDVPSLFQSAVSSSSSDEKGTKSRSHNNIICSINKNSTTTSRPNPSNTDDKSSFRKTSHKNISDEVTKNKSDKEVDMSSSPSKTLSPGKIKAKVKSKSTGRIIIDRSTKFNTEKEKIKKEEVGCKTVPSKEKNGSVTESISNKSPTRVTPRAKAKAKVISPLLMSPTGQKLTPAERLRQLQASSGPPPPTAVAAAKSSVNTKPKPLKTQSRSPTLSTKKETTTIHQQDHDGQAISARTVNQDGKQSPTSQSRKEPPKETPSSPPPAAATPCVNQEPEPQPTSSRLLQQQQLQEAPPPSTTQQHQLHAPPVSKPPIVTIEHDEVGAPQMVIAFDAEEYNPLDDDDLSCSVATYMFGGPPSPTRASSRQPLNVPSAPQASDIISLMSPEEQLKLFRKLEAIHGNKTPSTIDENDDEESSTS